MGNHHPKLLWPPTPRHNISLDVQLFAQQSILQDIDFVEKRYRITNPDYADRRRRYTLRELGRLNDQGASAGCGNLGPLPGDNVLLSW